MNRNFSNMRNGYLDTINRGISGVRRFSGRVRGGSLTKEEAIGLLAEKIKTSDAVVIGAGAGLSTSAGYTYSGERMEKWFHDFMDEYGIKDMYLGIFYPYPSKSIFWAFWARYIYINRYMTPPKKVYEDLLACLLHKEYFVITTNVDHCFQRAGSDKKRLFYTQGDYGLFQSTDPRNRRTYDNESWVMRAMESMGFSRNAEGVFEMPADGSVRMEIPDDLIPVCPDDGAD